MSSEKRQFERFTVSLPVRFEFGGSQGVGRSRDLSLGGMFILTETPAPYGTVLKVFVELPHLSAPAEFEATVRWSGTDGMGVQFGTMRALETWAINQLLRR